MAACRVLLICARSSSPVPAVQRFSSSLNGRSLSPRPERCRSALSAQGRPNACRLSRDGPEREAWQPWRQHGERVSCRHTGAPFGSVRLFGDSTGRTVRAEACEASASSNTKSPQPSGLRRTDVRCGRAILREGRQRRSSRGRERQKCVELLVTPWISVTEQHGRRPTIASKHRTNPHDNGSVRCEALRHATTRSVSCTCTAPFRICFEWGGTN